MKASKMLKLAVIAAFLFYTVHGVPNRAKFGETCGDGVRCDARASLTCSNSTCVCVKADEMTYDKDRTKCVVLSGERCSYTAVELDEDKKWTEKLDCVPNANCNQDGFCACNSDYFENFEGFCVSRKSFGANCTSNEQCQAKLLCNNGTCVCKEGIGNVHDPVKGGCVLQEGQICRNANERNAFGICVLNTVCSPAYDGSYYSRHNPGYCRCNSGYQRTTTGLCQPLHNSGCDHSIPCIGNLVCNSSRRCDCRHPLVEQYNQNKQTCECSSNYKLDVSGKCLSKHNITCSYSSECVDNLVCVGRKCSCPFPNHQNYKEDLSGLGCVGDIGSPCSSLIDGQIKTYPCTKNAHCKNSSGISECACKTGFVEGENKQCEVSHGQPCSAAVKCDSVAGLVCKNEICSCPYLQEYDMKVEKCKGLVGAVCDPFTEGFCIDGAICDRFKHRSIVNRWNLGRRIGVCRCNRTEELSSGRICSYLQPTTTLTTTLSPISTSTDSSTIPFTTFNSNKEEKDGNLMNDSHDPSLIPSSEELNLSDELE